MTPCSGSPYHDEVVGTLMHYKGAISPDALLTLQGARANGALLGTRREP
jgi:hypothetical protein